MPSFDVVTVAKFDKLLAVLVSYSAVDRFYYIGNKCMQPEDMVSAPHNIAAAEQKRRSRLRRIQEY